MGEQIPLFGAQGNGSGYGGSDGTGTAGTAVHPGGFYQLVGLHGGSVIVLESDMMCALDPVTGKLRWQRRHSGRQAALLPAAKDTLVTVHLDKPLSETERKAAKDNVRQVRRYVRWISSKDGSTVKEIPIEGESATYDVLQMSSDGARIFGLANFDLNRKQHHSPKVFMVEIAN